MPKGEFKLARHIGGRGHYGWVVVDVERTDSGTHVVLSSAAEICGNGQSIAHDRAQDWVEAAFQGCRDAIEWARQRGMVEPYRVEVDRIEGLYADTLDEHLRVAARAAVLRAMPMTSGDVDVTLEEGAWMVRVD